MRHETARPALALWMSCRMSHPTSIPPKSSGRKCLFSCWHRAGSHPLCHPELIMTHRRQRTKANSLEWAMQAATATDLARKLIGQYDLDGWQVEFSRAARTLGLCVYGKKVIRLSRSLVALN